MTLDEQRFWHNSINQLHKEREIQPRRGLEKSGRAAMPVHDGRVRPVQRIPLRAVRQVDFSTEQVHI